MGLRSTIPTRSGVRTASSQFREMLEQWELLYDLMGGTRAMRAEKEKWLPKNPLESKEKYEARLCMTFLYNAYRRTIMALIGGAFMQNVTVTNMPPELEYLLSNADGSGKSLTAVAATLCKHLLITGKAHPYVDFPKTEGIVTVADFRNGVRPYIYPVDPRNLIGWQVRYDGSKEVIDEIRITEQILEVADDWSETTRDRVRVIRPGEYETHERLENEFTLLDEESGTFTLDYVPIIPIYEEKRGTFLADPPLEDLAWLNLRHWQSSSEQNNILHVARVPILFASGFAEGELDMAKVSAYGGITASNEQADLKYVEHSGKAISSGRDDLKDIEERMAHMGSDILTQKGVSRQTASARQIDQAESLSTFQVILRNLEHGLEKCVQTAGDWIGVDASEVQITVGNDLAIPANEANPVADLFLLLNSGRLTEQEFMVELKRRGHVAPTVSEKINPQPLQSENETENDSEDENSSQNQ